MPTSRLREQSTPALRAAVSWSVLPVIGLTAVNFAAARSNDRVSGSPEGVRDSGAQFTELARAYKQINAPNGALARASLVISTRALASGNSGDDSTYINLENELGAITTQRDALTAQTAALLQNAEFNSQRIHENSERELVHRAKVLLSAVEALAKTP